MQNSRFVVNIVWHNFQRFSLNATRKLNFNTNQQQLMTLLHSASKYQDSNSDQCRNI